MPSFFTARQASSIKIQELIFHVVGPGALSLFDEVLGGDDFKPFFIKLVEAASGGKVFNFNETSGIPASIKPLMNKTGNFIDISKALARGFHESHLKSSSRGVLLFSQFTCENAPYWLLAKYDEMTVIQFEEVEKEGRRVAKLLDVRNTLVEDPKSLQKAILFTGVNSNDPVYIFDRTNRKEVARYLRSWLDVKAQYTDESATAKLHDVMGFFSTKVFLSPDTQRNWRTRLYSAICSG